MAHQDFSFWEGIKDFGLPRLIIALFLLCLLATAAAMGLPMDQLASSMMTRFGMNAIMVLAMIPTIQAGAGPNFGIPLGIVCGLVATTLAVELDLRNFTALAFALAVGMPLGALSGYFYGLLLNKVKGQEMTVGTYMGFSVVSLMCIFWLMAPYKSPEMIWPYGGTGLRVTIVMDGRLERILDRLWSFQFMGATVPTGLLLMTALVCLCLWIYQRTSSGLAMAVVGSNPRFAESSGLNVNRYRILSCMISNALGALGIVVYSQSFGFVQLYQAPLYMGLYCVSAILIGGASLSRATIAQALVGTALFQSLLVVSVPVANAIFQNNLSEVARVIVSNGIILYALTRREKGGDLR